VGCNSPHRAVLLLASGLHKMIRRDRTQAVVREFAGVRAASLRSRSRQSLRSSLLASLLLWTPSFRMVGGALAALIWGGYLALILRAIAQGRRDVDCGAPSAPAGVRWVHSKW